MNRPLMMLCGATLALSLSPALAESDGGRVFGFQDYRGTLTPSPGQSNRPIVIHTRCCDIIIGPYSMHVDVFTDTITIEVQGQTPVAAKAFVKPLGTCETEVTVVYGVDLNPDGALGPMTGFDPASPQIKPGSEDTFFGRSGKAYPARTTFMTLERLRASFPDYDLDASFHGAPPDSLLLVSTAVVPGDDFSPFQAGAPAGSDRPGRPAACARR